MVTFALCLFFGTLLGVTILLAEALETKGLSLNASVACGGLIGLLLLITCISVTVTTQQETIDNIGSGKWGVKEQYTILNSDTTHVEYTLIKYE